MRISLRLSALVVALSCLIGADSASNRAAPSATSAASELYVEDLPGVRAGHVSAHQRQQNTAIINRALAQGVPIHLRSGTRIEIGSSLLLPSGAALIGSGSGAQRPVIVMPAAEFANADNSGAHRYGPTAVGINFSGVRAPSSGVRLENFILESDPSEGRYLRGIVGRNVQDCTISNVEVRGLPTGVGIALASADRCSISHVYIHDFADRTDWATMPQTTAIEIDNDLVNDHPSSGVAITNFVIDKMLVEGPFLAHWGYQSDGINVANDGSRVTITNGRISNTGEGIDTFGTGGTISNVEISNSYQFGLKFIHGASRNSVSNVQIRNSGIAGVTFSGSQSRAHDTSGNVLRHILISGIDPNGVFKDHSTAGVLIAHPATMPGKPRDNQVIQAQIDLDPNGKYGWLDTSTGSGNLGSEIQVSGGAPGARAVFITHGASRVVLGSAPGAGGAAQ
jgi:hypothetical protein